MILLTNAKIALDSLRATRVRTYLTMLGIVIGVASVTLILALGESVKNALNQQVTKLDNNIIVVRPGKNQKGILGDNNLLSYSPLGSYATTTLTEQDYKTITKLASIKYAAPLMLINGNVSAKHSIAEQASILATTSQLAPILGLSATQGQFIDEQTNNDTVVIGNQLAVDLFGTDQAIGQIVKIRGRDHTVIGVLKKNGGPIGINGISMNYSAIINLEDGKTFNQGIAQVQQINVVAKSKQQYRDVINEIRALLLKNHNQQEDFSVLGGEDAAVVSKNFYQLVTAITAVIASVSLLVGGVGIMNIMLVGVAERTGEIGVRKSLGASNQHILWQFLIEALIMSLSGGIIGVIVAYVLAGFIGLLYGFIPVIAWQTILIAFILSVGVGVVFGLTPAVRAARKDPIEALRQNT